MRQMRKYQVTTLWSAAFLLLLLPWCVQAKDDLQFEDIIQILDHTNEQFTYIGTKFIVDYTPTRRSTTLVKIARDAASGVQKQEVSALQAGESQIILDDGKFLWHYIPSQRSVVKKKRRLSLVELSKRIRSKKDLIQQNYAIYIETLQEEPELTTAPQHPLAMGDVTIHFQPKTYDRPTWKIWIDREHGIVVRTEIYDLNGELALLSGFSEITFQSKLPEEALTMIVPQGTTLKTSVEQTFQTGTEAQQEVNFAISQPTYLPPGFILSSAIVTKTEHRERVQLTYIDGMSSISVFEDKVATAAPEVSKPSKEVTINNTVKGTFYDHGLLKILNWQLTENVYVTLVGEVADTELLKMAASITNPE